MPGFPRGVAAVVTSTAVVASGLMVAAAPSVPADTGCPDTSAYTSTNYSGGNGTAESPYLISSETDLQHLRETPGDWGTAVVTPVYRITRDLDMAGCTWINSGLGAVDWNGNDGNAWKAVLDGAGHTISGLTVTGRYAGLVFTLKGPGGVVRNLGFTGAVRNTDNSNGLAGGLVGYNYGGTVENSWSSASVTVETASAVTVQTGGIVGQLRGGTIRNSYFTGVVNTTTLSGTSDSYAGGVVGLINNGGQVIDSYANATITLTNSSKAAAGLVGNNSGSILGSFCTQDPCVDYGSSSGATLISTAELQQMDTFVDAGWDLGYGAFSTTGTVWGICTSAPYLSAFESSAPCTASAPTIASVSSSGSAVAGSNLSGSVGAVVGAPTPALSYEWQVADTSAGTYAAATGSGSSTLTYTIDAADFGKYLRLAVTATNMAGTAVEYSTSVGPVSGTAPAIGGVNLTGTVAVGSAVIAAGTSVSGVPTPSVTYAWETASTASGSFTTATGSGADTATYTPTSADAGQWLQVTASASNGEGPTATVTSTPVQIGPSVAITPTSTIAGGEFVASVVPTTGTTVQWQQETSSGSGVFTDIGGETETTLSSSSSQVGLKVRAVATYAGASTVSTATQAVTALQVTSAPVISGTAVEGGTLTATAASANAGTLAYSWERETSPSSGTYSDTGVSALEYPLGVNDVGLRLRLVATTTNGSATATGTSTASSVVVPSGAIAGDAVVGSTLALTATTGSTIQWQREDSAGSGTFSDVAGETGTTYTIGSGDLGLKIRAVLTNNGATTETDATSAVAALSLTAPSLSGTASVLSVLSRGDSTANAGSVGYSWQFSADGSAWSDTGDSGSTFTLAADHVGGYIRVRATSANGSASAASESSALGPIAAAQLTAPGSVAVTGGPGAGTLRVTFEAPTNAPSGQTYDLSVYSDATLSSLAASEVGYTSGATIIGLASGQRYWVTVTAVASSGYLAATSSATSGVATSPSPPATIPESGSGSSTGGSRGSDSTREDREPGAVVTDSPRPAQLVTSSDLPDVSSITGAVRTPLGASFEPDSASQRQAMRRGGISVLDGESIGTVSQALILRARYREDRTTDARVEVPVNELVQLTSPEVPTGTQVVGWVQDVSSAWFTLGAFRADSAGVAVLPIRFTEVGDFVLAMTTDGSRSIRARAGSKEPQWGSSVMRVFVSVVPANPVVQQPTAQVTRAYSFTLPRSKKTLTKKVVSRIEKMLDRCDSIAQIVVRQGGKVKSPKDKSKARQRAVKVRNTAARASEMSRSAIPIVWWKQRSSRKTTLTVVCNEPNS